MAAKKRGRKKKVSKRVVKKKTRRKTIVKTVSPRSELALLHKIDRKVSRIDETVNAGFHLKRRAKKAKRKHDIESAFEEAERSGSMYE